MTVLARWLPSIRTVLSGVMLAVVALVVAALALLAWDAGHQAIDQTTRLLATEVARGVDGDLDFLVERPVRLVNRLAGRLRDPEEREAYVEAVREAVETTPEVSLAAFVTPDGKSATALRTDDGVRLRVDGFSALPSWFSAALRTQGPVWGEVRYHGAHSALVLEVARAVWAADGTLLGVAASGFRLDRLEGMMATYAAEYGAIAFLLDPAGRLLATHHHGAIGEAGGRINAADSGHPVIRAVASAIQVQEMAQRVVVDGEPYDAFVHAIDKGLPERWRLLSAVPRSQFDSPLRRHMQSMVMLTALALLGAVILAVLVSRGAARPLLEVVRGATRIRDGELDVMFQPSRVRELASLTDALRSMISGLRERERMKDAFARYVSPGLVERVASDPEALRPGGRLVDAVIVFTDLRGFTALSEKLGPEQTVALINRYFDAMTSVCNAHHGYITDLLGDGMLIAFGLDGEDGAARRAVRCMLAMQAAVEVIDRETRNEFGVRLEVGAGAHFGEVVLGNIGSVSRIKYGVIGDAVNTAARVEGLTVGGEVLVTESLYRACGDDLEVDSPREIPVKGKDEPLRVYGVRALHGADGLTLSHAEPEHWAEVDVEGIARRLFGKVLSDESLAVRVVGAENRFLLIECAGLAMHDDVRIDVANGTIYGRVRREEGAERWLVRWTGGAQDPLLLLGGENPS